MPVPLRSGAIGDDTSVNSLFGFTREEADFIARHIESRKNEIRETDEPAGLELCDKIGIIAQMTENAMETTTISIDSDLYKRMEESAKERHMSIQSLIERAVSLFIAPGHPRGGGAASPLAADEAEPAGARPSYIISPRMRRLMGAAEIKPGEVEQDERLKYLLSR